MAVTRDRVRRWHVALWALACAPAAAVAQELPGEGIRLKPGETNLHCVEYGAGAVWCGLSREPSLLVKVDPATLRTEQIRFGEANGLHDLSFDGRRIWAAHSSGHLSVVDPSTLAAETFPLEPKSFAYASRFDGKHLWVGMYSQPGRVVRVDPETRRQDAFVIREAPRWSVRGTAWDGKRLWVCVNTVPAMVAVLDPQTGEYRTLYLGDGRELKLCTSIVHDGTSVWVGLDTLPATLVKIDPATFEYRVYRLPAGTSCARELLLAQGALWVGLYMAPARIVRFDLTTETWQIVTLPKDYYHSRDMASDGKNLWIGFQNLRYAPSALYRLPIADAYPMALASGPIEAPSLQKPLLQPPSGPEEAVAITSQDWYRVRRGEDHLAWGETKLLPGLPKVVLSLRASQELAFLTKAQQADVRRQLEALSADPRDPSSRPIRLGAPLRLCRIGELRLVHRFRDDGTLDCVTIRKREGQSFDPENMGPPPDGPTDR